MVQGSPMTFKSSYQVSTLEPAAMGTTDKGEAKQQTIVVGPVAAFESMKMLGTNGGGFYGMNSAHPFENPTGLTNFFNSLAMMIFPFALVLMYGRMLGRMRHCLVIFSVMLLLMAGTIVWSVYFDTLKPNPGLTGPSRGPNLRNPQRDGAGRKAGGDPAGGCRACRSTSTWAISKARKCASGPRPGATLRRSPRT